MHLDLDKVKVLRVEIPTYALSLEAAISPRPTGAR